MIRRHLYSVVCLAGFLAFGRSIPALAGVTDEGRAAQLFAEVRTYMTSFGLGIDRDILLKLRTRDELNTENAGNGGRALELNGFYRPYNPESIWVVSGMSESETVGVMAHELTHAWQSTNAPLQDRKLAEGFARWVEHKMLLKIGDTGRADTLVRDPDPDYGGGLRFLLDLESRSGTASVIEFARNETKIP